MSWKRLLRAFLFGATVSCQGHTQPDPALPLKAYSRYHLIIDDTLPVYAIKAGAEQWVWASDNVLSFDYEVRSHDAALGLIDSGRHDTIVIVDTEGTCPKGALACYQWPGVIYFRSYLVDAYDGWDVVPAHELGHAMGLEHTDEKKWGIMNPYVEYQYLVTYDDWLRLKPLVGR